MPFLGHWYILLIILAIVLIVYGPGKLPEVGGAVGKAMREFRKASTDFQDEIKKSASSESHPEVRPTPDPAAEVRPTPDPSAQVWPTPDPPAQVRPAPDRPSTNVTSPSDTKA